MENQREFQIVKFSPELKAAIKQYAEIQDQMGNYLFMAYEKYPDKERQCDVRDFSEMIEVLPGLSAEQMEEKCTKYIKDYTGSDPDKRKKILDDFYDRFLEFDINARNLSCLKGEGKGVRGVDGLTESEQEVMKLITQFGRTQAMNVKLKENPEYKRERFGDPMALERLNVQDDTTHAMNFYVIELLANNHLSHDFKEIDFDTLCGKDQVTAMDIVTQRTAQIMAGMEGRPIQMDIHFSLSQEKNGLYGLDKGQLSGENAGNTDNVAERAFEFSLGAIYDIANVRQWMNDQGMDEFDLIHIDGLSAREQFAGKYEGGNLNQYAIKKQMKKDVMKSVMEGSHHIDLITLDMNAKGDIVANPHAVKVDLHAFDQLEKQNEHGRTRHRLDRGPFKIKTRADMADRINKDKQSVEDRLSHVIPRINEKLAVQTNAKEQDKSDHINHGLQKEEANGLKQGRKEVSLEVLKEKETGNTNVEKKTAWETKNPQKSSMKQRKMGEKDGIGSHRAKDTRPVIGSHRAKDTQAGIGKH